MREEFVSKEYLRSELESGIADFRLARNEDEQWDARKSITKTLQIADMYYGYAFADELEEQLDELKEEMGYPLQRGRRM